MDNYRIMFHWHGVDPDEVFTTKEKKKITDEFVANYNLFCDISNPLMEKINKVWEEYEHIKDSGDTELAEKCADHMGITMNTTYEMWIEKQYKDIVDDINKFGFGKELLGFIFMDGNIPVYGGKFKDHPEWTIDFTLKKEDL